MERQVGEREGNGYNYAKISGGKVEYKKIGTTWYYVAEYTFNDFGSYTISFTAAKEGYTVQTERAAAEEVAPVRVLVNINTASAEELETVTGIGPVLAQAILDYRAEHGDFQTLDELLEVRGIGSAKLDAMRDEITTGGDAP